MNAKTTAEATTKEATKAAERAHEAATAAERVAAQSKTEANTARRAPVKAEAAASANHSEELAMARAQVQWLTDTNKLTDSVAHGVRNHYKELVSDLSNLTGQKTAAQRSSITAHEALAAWQLFSVQPT